MSVGSDLMGEINRGNLTQRSSEYALRVKADVTEALVEVITFGARIRPLILDNERVGWLRSLGYSEKKQIDVWFPSEEDRARYVLRYATSLPVKVIASLDMNELRNIIRLVLEANMADLSLFPYISAFASTQSSISLWATKHNSLFQPNDIVMPDGGCLKQVAISDHVRLWASLSTIRDATILKIDNAINSAVILKGSASGEGINSYIESLNRSLAYYSPDSIEPWMNSIDFVAYNSEKKEFNDGYGHSHEDASTEGLLREMQGMIQGDKHENLMERFYTHQINTETERKRKIEEMIKVRREQLEAQDEESGALVVRTEREVMAREREIKEQNYEWVNRENLKMFEQPDMESSDEEIVKRMSRYL